MFNPVFTLVGKILESFGSFASSLTSSEFRAPDSSCLLAQKIIGISGGIWFFNELRICIASSSFSG